MQPQVYELETSIADPIFVRLIHFYDGGRRNEAVNWRSKIDEDGVDISFKKRPPTGRISIRLRSISRYFMAKNGRNSYGSTTQKVVFLKRMYSHPSLFLP